MITPLFDSLYFQFNGIIIAWLDLLARVINM